LLRKIIANIVQKKENQKSCSHIFTDEKSQGISFTARLSIVLQNFKLSSSLVFQLRFFFCRQFQYFDTDAFRCTVTKLIKKNLAAEHRSSFTDCWHMYRTCELI